jgi:hypothetical protein
MTNEIKDFNLVQSMSMVATIQFDGYLDIYKVFRLLEVNRQDNFVKNSYIDYQPLIDKHETGTPIIYNGKDKPFFGYAGPILYMSHDLCIRSRFMKSKKTKHFKNCIMMYMSVSSKNVNIKLSDSSMHLCGLTDMNMGLEAFNVLKYNIDSIENFVNYMNTNIEKTVNTINYIKSICKGNIIYVVEDSNYIVDASDIYILDNNFTIKPDSNSYNHLISLRGNLTGKLSEKMNMICTYCSTGSKYNTYPILCTLVHNIKIPETSNLPENCDDIIYDFMIDKIYDFNIYELYTYTLEWIKDIKNLYIKPIISSFPKYCNINYTYNIGNIINRTNFRNYVNESRPFVAEYKKSVDRYVTVYLPFEIPDHLIDEIKRNEKNGKTSHKFIIYKTGSVTQSGPHPEMNQEAYYKFMEMLSINKSAYIK